MASGDLALVIIVGMMFAYWSFKVYMENRK